MAFDIDNSAAFTTANMKPNVNDQADALWAQNLADNTGFLYYRPYPGPTFFAPAYSSPGGGTAKGTFFFRKEPGAGTLGGTIVGTINGAANNLIVRVDGVIVYSKNHTGTLFKTGFATSISHLTNFSDYAVTFDWGAGASANDSSMSLTSWQTI